MGWTDYISSAYDTASSEVRGAVDNVEAAGAALYHDTVEGTKKLAHKAVETAEEVGHLGKVFAQGTAHALIQEPVDGLEQLANHVTKPLFHYELPKLHIVDSPKCKDTADRWANGLGEVTGFVGSFLIAGAGIAKGLSLVGKAGEIASVAERLPMASRVLTTIGELGGTSHEAGMLLKAGRAATQAGLYTFLFKPEKEDGHYWRHKLVSTAAWAAGGGLGYLGGRALVGSLEKAGLPLEKSLLKLDRFKLISNLSEKGGLYSALSQAELQLQHVAHLVGEGLSNTTVRDIASLADTAGKR